MPLGAMLLRWTDGWVVGSVEGWMRVEWVMLDDASQGRVGDLRLKT